MSPIPTRFGLHVERQHVLPLSVNIPHPNQSELVNQSAMRRVVFRIDSQNKKDNTKLAYDPKVQEFHQYCNHRHRRKEDDPLSISKAYTVTYMKAHEFMFYQSMRGCRKRGGKKKKRKRGLEPVMLFDGVEFDAIMKDYNLGEAEECHEPKKPLGYAQLNTYKAALRNLHDEQVAHNINNIPWEMVWNADLKLLMQMVKKRKARIKKANYGEKVDCEFAPYTAVEEIPNIEAEMWNRGYGGSWRSAYAWLRNRYALLQSYCGILRCESLFKAELSDMLGITMKKKQDPHRLYLLIMQMASGR
jgi:hypothetical protein